MQWKVNFLSIFHDYFHFQVTHPATVLIEEKVDFSTGREIITGHYLDAQKRAKSGAKQNGINDIK